MGVFAYEHEFTSTVAPNRLFKAFVLGTDTIYSKVAPQVIKRIETIEGDGGPGTIKKITFGEERSLIEVDAPDDKLEYTNHQVKFQAAVGGRFM